MTKTPGKLRRQMLERGWTDEHVEEARAAGPVEARINYETNGPAARYVHSVTGRSVIIDDETGGVLHVGRDRHLYD